MSIRNIIVRIVFKTIGKRKNERKKRLI